MSADKTPQDWAAESVTRELRENAKMDRAVADAYTRYASKAKTEQRRDEHLRQVERYTARAAQFDALADAAHTIIRRKPTTHVHEGWMLQDKPEGGKYCVACGADVIEAKR